MDFISNQKEQIGAMLKTIGVEKIEELFTTIPNELKCLPPEENDGLSEWEGMQHVEQMSKKNLFLPLISYLGAGSYEHHIPCLVNAICSKSEFLTSYTPYQAEASQGMLQAIFEYQSAICALTGMDISNASLYDGATACAEAVLMALRCNEDRNKIIIGNSLHPHYSQVLEQYLSLHAIQIEKIPFDTKGQLDFKKLKSVLDDKTAAVLFQYPNFLGIIDDLIPVFEQARKYGALSIVCANPLIYGAYASAKELGADIAVGDAQPLGLPLQYGGPYLGYLACQKEFLRQIPGRVVGETVDIKGRRGFVLTLQAREQHIRRDKATSNICTNQALAALASLITILWYGKEGLLKLALTNHQRAAYLKANLEKLANIKMYSQAPFFNEFVVSYGKPAHAILTHFRKHNIEPGLDLGRYYPNFAGYFLVAVTEIKSKAMLDEYLEIAALTEKL